MRVAPINLASRRNFQPQKNLNFGKIEEENRQRIIDSLPTYKGIDKKKCLIINSLYKHCLYGLCQVLLCRILSLLYLDLFNVMMV